MDWLGDVNEMVKLVGVPGVVVVLWAVMPLVLTALLITIISIGAKQSRDNNQAFTKQMESLTIAISNLSDKVLDPPMNLADSLEYFYLVMNEHVGKKLSYLGEILRKNSINNRKSKIQKNIENEFRSITTKEANKLSRKKSVCGDMGKVLQESIDWKPFLNEVYSAFFVERKENSNKDFDYFKIQDVKSIMYGTVDKIAKKLEDDGVRN